MPRDDRDPLTDADAARDAANDEVGSTSEPGPDLVLGPEWDYYLHDLTYGMDES